MKLSPLPRVMLCLIALFYSTPAVFAEEKCDIASCKCYDQQITDMREMWKEMIANIRKDVLKCKEEPDRFGQCEEMRDRLYAEADKYRDSAIDAFTANHLTELRKKGLSTCIKE